MSYITTTSVTYQGDLATYGFDFSSYALKASALDGTNVSVNSMTGLNISSLNTAVAVKRAEVINSEIIYLKEIIERRQKAIDDLGQALAIASNLEADLEKTTDTTGVNSTIQNTLHQYIVPTTNISSENASLVSWDTKKWSKGDLQKIEQYFQSAMDLTNNDMDQDMVRMQSIFSKRDSAYELANKLQKKFLDAVSSNISSIS